MGDEPVKDDTNQGPGDQSGQKQGLEFNQEENEGFSLKVDSTENNSAKTKQQSLGNFFKMLESANRSRDPEVSSKDATVAKVNAPQSEDLTKSVTNTEKNGGSNSAAEKSSLVQAPFVDQVEEDFEEAVEDNEEEEDKEITEEEVEDKAEEEDKENTEEEVEDKAEEEDKENTDEEVE